MQLFDGTMHEPLSTTPWDATRAKEVADRIASDTAALWAEDGSWPGRAPEVPAAEPDDSFWTGAAGVLWALDRLGKDVGERRLLAGHSAHAAAATSRGLMHGEVGVLLVSWKLEPTTEKEERLFHLVRANSHNPSHELFNGSPGTMLAALHLFEQTGDDRWRDLWRTCADALLEQFGTDPEYGCRLWIQYRRGRLIRSIGAGHGFAGNVLSFLRGAALLDEDQLAELERAARDRCDAGGPATRTRQLADSCHPYWARRVPDPRPVVSRRARYGHGRRGSTSGEDGVDLLAPAPS